MTSTLLVLALAIVTLSQGILVNRTADYGTEPIMIDRTNRSLSRTNSIGLDIVYSNFLVHKRYINSLREAEIERLGEERLEEESLRRVKRAEEEQDPRCEKFMWESKDQTYIMHPHNKDTGSTNYYSGISCVTVINGGEGTVVQLTFVDMFHIEYHPDCEYDFLEIRDGEKGYANILDKVCGEAFPRQITTSGPYVWMKFKSDDTIEYEGFRINIQFIPTSTSISIPKSCYFELEGMYGIIDSSKIEDCRQRTTNQALDVLWTIKVPENHRINLNFTSYSLAKPNDCEDNLVQVFDYTLEYQSKLAHYCGSVANAVNTKGVEGGKGGKDEKGNIMYVRLYASKAGRSSQFNATFTAYRSLDPNKDEKCDPDTEFNCEDNTCIAVALRCDKYAHCRLKADEEPELCKEEAESMISKPHILTILIIFSLILSGMSFVFLFKCIRKLYRDHKIIKEHIKQSCEDRIDTLVASRLTLDAKRLQRDSEPRASLERDNHTNEMFKQQRKISQQRRPTSIDSDLIQETRLDMDDPWRRDVDTIPREPDDARPERNGIHEEKRRMRRDTSRKEDSLRKSKEEEKREERREIREDRREIREERREIREERRENRDVSVGAPDTKESGCQTRESLFQTDTTISSDGSNTTNSRGFSTFGYSGATIVQPPPTTTSEITIELLSKVAPDTKQKKIPDRRPMSTETTRSAPDVIIVSKPVR
ncbi:neuropilin and tolloid-like protein 1 [Aricia agestis]|uniref:neuropilin and tolloid-like protein 1 n=1 Tax=Aricia agestis TaxID=91739 RepID=UPI001C20A8AA|nr:neuropilin and tolloid-like protein 1 [Aricia agestis]XP_041978317.1 neuropilin and tolloid-like protein 1 [Aricia agestis]